jgi:hypothetical protein
MRKRIDFSRLNRPYCYYSRIALLHSEETVFFKIDSGFNFLLRAVNEKHNERAARCPVSETFLPAVVNLGTSEITVTGQWPVGKSIVFSSTIGLPAPLVAGQTYFVKSFGGGLITLSLTYGGALLALTTQGAGVHTIRAAACPDIGYRIGRVSSGIDDHYSPLFPQFFASPGPVGCNVYVDNSYTAQQGNLGVNFTATARKLAAPKDSLFIWGETIEVRISGQKINSATIAEDNLPSYADILLVGRHYPEGALPEWRD